MQHPVGNGAGDDRIPKDLSPIPVGLIRREDHGAPLITLGDELEEEIRSQTINGDVSDFINHQQFDLRKGLELLLQGPLLMRLPETGNQGLGSHKEGSKAFLDGLNAQSDG